MAVDGSGLLRLRLEMTAIGGVFMQHRRMQPASCPAPRRHANVAAMLRNFYAFAEIDRAGHRRRDAAWLSERIVDPKSRFLPVWRNQNLVHVASEPPRAAFLAPDEVVQESGEAVLLRLHH